MYKIMIVDDEPIMRKGLNTLIDWKALDCEIVFAAENGQIAIDNFDIYKPDIIISDIRMPKVDGLELSKLIHEKQSNCKIILLTAYADFNYAKQAIHLGVSYYVTKTGAMNEIIEAVNHCKEKIQKDSLLETPLETIAYILKSTISGNHDNTEILKKHISNHKLLQHNYFVIHGEVFEENQKDMDGLQTALITLLKDVFHEDKCFIFPMSFTSLAVVVFQYDLDIILHNCKLITQTLLSLTNATVYFSISDNQSSLLTLNSAYKNSLKYSDKKFFNQNKFLFTSNGDSYKKRGESYNHFELTENLSKSILLAQSDDSQNQLNLYFKQQEKSMLAPLEIKLDGIMLLNLCKHCLQQSNIDIEKLTIDFGLYHDTILQSSFYSEYKILLGIIVEEAVELIKKNTTISSPIDIAKQYINDNFTKPISINDIASFVNVNPSYLSRTFKNKTGIGLVDTINRKRVEVSKDLLRLGTAKVYEIADAVGFEDTTYFSHVFKKYTGMSPKEYQIKYQNK